MSRQPDDPVKTAVKNLRGHWRAGRADWQTMLSYLQGISEDMSPEELAESARQAAEELGWPRPTQWRKRITVGIAVVGVVIVLVLLGLAAVNFAPLIMPSLQTVIAQVASTPISPTSLPTPVPPTPVPPTPVPPTPVPTLPVPPTPVPTPPVSVTVTIGWLTTPDADLRQLFDLSAIPAPPVPGSTLYPLVHGTLLRFDENWNLQPNLALTYTVDNKQLVATVWIPGDGQQQVVKALQDGGVNGPLFQRYRPLIDGVEPKGEKEIIIRCKGTDGDGLKELLAALPIAGTGPFRVAEDQSSPEKVVLERNLHYLAGRQPAIERLIIQRYSEIPPVGDALKAGEIDVIGGDMAGQTDELRQLLKDSSVPIKVVEEEQRLIVRLDAEKKWAGEALQDLAQVWPEGEPLRIFRLDEGGISGLEMKYDPGAAERLARHSLSYDIIYTNDKDRADKLKAKLTELQVSGGDMRLAGDAVGSYVFSPGRNTGDKARLFFIVQRGVAAYRTDRFQGWFSLPGPLLNHANAWAILQLRSAGQ